MSRNKVVCPKCDTLYVPGERHGCAERSALDKALAAWRALTPTQREDFEDVILAINPSRMPQSKIALALLRAAMVVKTTAAEPEPRHKDARAYAQDMASFAFNTAMQMLRPPVDGDYSPWLDKITDEFETQILAMRAAVEPEAKALPACCSGENYWRCRNTVCQCACHGAP